MIKILKWVGGILLLLLLVGFVWVKVESEPAPKGETGAAADALAQKMLTAIDQTAWDSTRYVQWTFVGVHDFFWDKERHLVEVKWGDKKVLLNPNEISGKAWVDGEPVAPDEADKLVKKAWSYFANDGFWLNAPAKVFDPGTTRSLVALENGEEGLLVEYSSGGVTPGDSYLWLLDENGLPTAWKMWVKILPLKGIMSSWEGWTTLSTGAKIATIHSTKGFETKVTNLKAGQRLEDMGRSEDPFIEL